MCENNEGMKMGHTIQTSHPQLHSGLQVTTTQNVQWLSGLLPQPGREVLVTPTPPRLPLQSNSSSVCHLDTLFTPVLPEAS